MAAAQRILAVRALGPALLLGCVSSVTCRAQSDATAVQPLALSAFGAATGTWTNLLGGHNAGITAGGDLGFLTYRGFRPVFEVRGTLPIEEGRVDSQKSLIGGLKLEREYGPLHPYVNFLVGRGSIDYQNGGFYSNGLLYFRTVTTVYSPGFGLDYDVTHHWSAKVDFQYQHWDTPVLPSGVINPRQLSFGAVYRFDFNHSYKVPRHRR